MAFCLGLPRWTGTRKVKPIRILLTQGTVSGCGISWAICIYAHRSRQITTPAPHNSVFTGWMPFLPPNQQCQSTEGNVNDKVSCNIDNISSHHVVSMLLCRSIGCIGGQRTWQAFAYQELQETWDQATMTTEYQWLFETMLLLLSVPIASWNSILQLQTGKNKQVQKLYHMKKLTNKCKEFWPVNPQKLEGQIHLGRLTLKTSAYSAPCFHQPQSGKCTSGAKLRPTQPPTPCRTGNEYQPKCTDALQLWSKSRFASLYLWKNMWVAGKMV